MAVLENIIAGKLAKPYTEKAAKKVRDKLDETKENLETKAEGMALKSGLIGKKYSQEYEDEKRRESRGMKEGGKVSSASKRADGCAVRGKTKGKMV